MWSTQESDLTSSRRHNIWIGRKIFCHQTKYSFKDIFVPIGELLHFAVWQILPKNPIAQTEGGREGKRVRESEREGESEREKE